MMLKTITKFGLEYCDLETMLWNVSVMLRALYIHIDVRNKKPVPVVLYIVSLAVGLAYFYVYVVSTIWFVFCRCPVTGDVLAAIVVFSLAVSSEIGTVKLIYMYLHIDTVKQIVTECLACDSSVIPGSRFSDNLLLNLRKVKKRAMIFWLVIIGNSVVYVAKPLLTPGRHFSEDMFVLYGLEPMEQNPNYQIASVLMAAGAWFTTYLPANITAFLIVVTGYIEAQMLSLTEELINLWEDAEEHYLKITLTSSDVVENIDFKDKDVKNKILNDYVEEHLKDIIKAHGRNINLLHKVEDVFSGAIGMEFTLLVIGLIAELLGGIENTYLEIPFALMQVGMDCFTGQRLMDASIKFESAVYDCKWENYNPTNMKTVLMMLQNSQKTMKLTAGGIYVLSSSCFMMVIKSIYSASTTLSTAL